VLRNTFIHIQGIGEKTEQGLWQRGIRTWEDFLNTPGPQFSPGRDLFVRQDLELSLLHRKDIRFFSDRLSAGHMWRLFEDFRAGAVYLDIETSGGYQGMDEVTVIGLFDGQRVLSFVNGQNLDEFEAAVAHYDLVITFNGACFDLPFIRRWFPGISLPPAHIDLRFLFKRLGYRGGLKGIEKELGICRGNEIDGMNGFDAVRLWRAHIWGDREALDTLIRYNTADIVNLEPLMEFGYGEMRKRLMKLEV
jgi:uncharacterized protein YprB with RNaseH-like and TPR domain